MPNRTLNLSAAGPSLYADGLSNLVGVVNGITRGGGTNFQLVSISVMMRGYKLLAVYTLGDFAAIEVTAPEF